MDRRPGEICKSLLSSTLASLKMSCLAALVIITSVLILVIHVKPSTQSNVITTSFTGKQFIDFQIPSRHDENPKDKITLKFKTIQASGVILYSCGDEGDFLLLELKRGKLV